MPIILDIDQMQVKRQGEGWKEITLADEATTGAPAMAARRWSLGPNAVGPELVHGESDEMFYIISGGGTAVVRDERLELEPESVLWLEAGDRYHFEAGSQGLEILQGVAPAE